MSRAVFRSHRSEFNRKNEAFKDHLQSRMAMDIEVAIKTTAGTPVKTGGMKAEVRHFKNNRDQWRVVSGKEYSVVQEVGRRMTGRGAPTRQFRKYTTPGTKHGWFRRAIDSVKRNRKQYIMQAKQAVGL